MSSAVYRGQPPVRSNAPIEFGYLHVTRYGGPTPGGELGWIAARREAIAGRTILVLDDILDAGLTLSAIGQRMLDDAAVPCFTVVFAGKDIGRPTRIKADLVGLRLPNRYVFGFGMKVEGAWRKLPEICALRESA